MQRQALLALFDREMRIDAPPPGNGFKIKRDGAVVRILGPSNAAYDNYVIYSSLRTADAAAVIQHEISWFGDRKRAFEWKVFAHDNPPDLGDRLLRYGFMSEGREIMLALPLSNDGAKTRLAPDVLIRRVDSAEHLGDVLAVQNEVWGEGHDWLVDSLAIELAETGDDLEILVADLQGIGPVATSWMRRHQGTAFASIWGAATLSPYRKRGLYSALVERHLATARRRGARFMTVDANDNSRPILRRIGFQLLVGVQGFVWQPPA